MNLPPLFFLRHGQTEWNLEGRLQGHKDSALTPLGRAQAALQREILQPLLSEFPDFDIHASPLARAFDTAQMAAAPRPVQKVTALKEVYAGSWEGRLRAEIVAEIGGSASEEDMFSLFLSAPDGEGDAALTERCHRYLMSLKKPTVIVSHGVVSAVLRGLCLGLSFEDIAKLPHEQGVVTAISGGVSQTLRAPEEMRGYVAANSDHLRAPEQNT